MYNTLVNATTRKIRRISVILAQCAIAAAAHAADVVLRTTAELNAVLDRPSGDRMYFELRGTVQDQRDNRSYLIADDSGGSIVIINSDTPPNVGDAVVVTGTAEWERTNMIRWPFVHSVTVVGKGTVLEPVDAGIGDIIAGKFDYRKVRLTGTVIDASIDEIDPKFCQIVAGDGGMTMTITVSNDQSMRSWLNGLANAKIQAVGVCSPNAGYFRLFHTHSIFSRREDIAIVVPPPNDPFSVDPIGDIRHVNPQRIAGIQERRSFDGTVIAVWHGDRFLMKNRQDMFSQVILANDVTPPRVGEHVRAVGIPETDLFQLNLSSAIWRPEPGVAAAMEEPEDVSVKSLLIATNGAPRLDPSRHGRIVRIHGIVRSVPTPGFGDAILHLENGRFTIPVDFSSCLDALGGIAIGCEIEATGACILETESWRPNVPFPRAKGIRLVIRSAADVRILSNPPWWTPWKFMAVTTSLLILLSAIFAWNISLRRVAERRGRKLFKAEIGKVGAELRIGERTRLAVELHDSIAQNLTAISFQIASAISSRKISPEASEQHMQNADRMLHSCRTELRRCLWDLRNNTLEERDFREAIDKTISPVLGNAVPHIRFPVPRARISDTTAHAALSIIRELTFNAVLHGRAKNVWIAGEICERTLRFSVRDDGCGFDVAHHPGQSTGHFGLKGISERLQALDGKLSMSSSSHGTRAVVSIHLPKPEGISS